MNFSFQDPGTRPPSFLGGFAEDTEEKDRFQTRAGFKKKAPLEFTKMIDEVKDPQNLSQESGTSS